MSQHLKFLRLAVEFIIRRFSRTCIWSWLVVNLLGSTFHGQDLGPKRGRTGNLHHPWIWEATHPSLGKLLLVGVVHVSDESERSLHSLYDAAFREVVQIRFETIPGQWDTPEARRLLHQRGVISRSSPDFSAYSSETTSILIRFRAELGEHLSQFARFEPWLTLLELEKIDSRRLGLMSSHSLEHHLLRLATNARVPVGPLETLGSQLDAFDKLDRKVQEDALVERLNSFRAGSDDLKAIRSAWIRGDLEGMLDALQLSQPVNRSDLRRSVIDDRNIRWLPILLKDTNQKKATLVVVGIEHIVTPKTGLIDLLTAKGFRISRYPLH